MNLTSPSQVKSWCIGNGFHPNRTLGQNFLIDRNVLDAIVAAAGVGEGQRVLEIGAGLGVLTEAMLHVGASVAAVEKDARLASRLAEALGSPPALRVIEADALELPLDELFTPPFDACVSNLPYSVGTRILLEIARHPSAPRRMTVLVQTEVAERLAAREGGGARGQAGVWVQRDYDVTLVREVKASCFWPRPEVGSTLVRLDRRVCPLSAAERQCFEALTRYAFMHRRKQLGAALRKAPAPLGRSDEDLARILEAAGVDAKNRAETLSNAQWLVLARGFAV
ncbi:MAG: 16S rRNA (adenine(1518)-N(6)/adenine(1519)-N(6))-dimethyltransferase RsmA [Kiritimatiellaeota bacterium]|nr:16S rRNA (adenine(1518)-N(6)/adenine(1519)-N(6))-dimethyltransferase RsmA [Kiritimatiellota bacterium]